MVSHDLFNKLTTLVNGSDQKGDPDEGVVAVRRAGGKLTYPELKCEAVEIIFQHLLQNEFPLWFALHLANEVAVNHLHDILAPELREDPQRLQPEDPKTEPTVDLNEFSSTVLHSFASACKELRAIPEHPPRPSLYGYSVQAIKNNRRKMEDRHVIVPNLNLVYPSDEKISNAAFFAVFDGHGGQECANYAATHLLEHIAQTLSRGAGSAEALTTGFELCETFLRRKFQRENLRSGTTAACALLIDKTVTVAWTGDSQAVLVQSNGECKSLTPCHDTKNQAECERIAAEGGVILNVRGDNRVNAIINVTRSLGDGYLKPPLSAVPDTASLRLTGNEAALILGCDGLWEGVSLDRCREVFGNFVNTRTTDQFSNLAKELVNEARSNNVSDNITALVVFLKTPEELKQQFVTGVKE